MKRATCALERHLVPYAEVGDHASSAWIATIDESAVRNTQNIDIALRRSDLDVAKIALAEVGFVYSHSDGINRFLEGANAKVRDSVRIVFSGEKTHSECLYPVPDVGESERLGAYRVLGLKAFVSMELMSFRLNNKVNLRDLLDVGLVDESWPSRFPPLLAERLQQILETPEG